MKLRIKGNSVRLRLSQKEVTTLVKTRTVSDHCDFGGNILTYSIYGVDGNEFTAKLNSNEIIVELPSSLLTDWDIDERVGFDHRSQDGLYLLIEKDWQCLKPRSHEDESDLYVNPQA